MSSRFLLLERSILLKGKKTLSEKRVPSLLRLSSTCSTPIKLVLCAAKRASASSFLSSHAVYCLYRGTGPEKNGLKAILRLIILVGRNLCIRARKKKAEVLTIPCIEHICYKIINEGNLRLGDAAGVSIKYWHYNRQTLSLLFISLRKQNCS